jgi:hypothetical protein
MSESSPPRSGRSLDVGTTRIIAGRWATGPSGVRPAFRAARNAFLDLRHTEMARRMLERLRIPFVEMDGRLCVMGDEAFGLANVLERDTRRPMSDGVISPREGEALGVIRRLAERLMGPPAAPGEPCTFSVPADPIDGETDVLYQRGSVERILRGLGYAPHALREGLAVVYAELADEGYTGVGISCGGGMFNVCLAYKGVEALSFSTVRGGDWIDQRAAQALGMTPAAVCAVKEGGFDLRAPRGRVEEALALYTRHLVRWTLEALARKFESRDVLPAFGRPVPMVLAGGMARAPGFAPLFVDELRSIRLPLAVSRLGISRQPITSAARGCLLMGEATAAGVEERAA